jgi:transcriptional regulator with XRE-family HTH domain
MDPEAVCGPIRAADDHQARLATNIDAYIGARLRQLRLFRGLSQERVAEAVGITFQQVQKYESGTNRIPASRLYSLAQYLGVSLDYFFEGVAKQESTEFPDYGDTPVAKLLASREGMELIKAFAGLGDARLQRAIVQFLTMLANTTTAQN